MALQAAVLRGDTKAVDILLANNSIDPHSNDGAGRTPLSYAGQKEVVELLLAKGVDPDSRCTSEENKGRTPLSFAASNGHKEVVELLLAKGVDPDSKCTDWKNNDGRTPLSFAASNGYKEVVELLLAKGVDPDSRCTGWKNKGRTPLSFAASNGYKEVVELLLTKGVDPDSRCTSEENEGRTPLSFAASNGYKEVVELLLTKGVDPDSRCTSEENEGRTPLSFAASNGYKEVVKLLLAKGVDPDSKDSQGQTPISYAADNGHKEVVELLLTKGVDPDSKCTGGDNNGRTPLSLAAEKGHEVVVGMLLANDSVERNSRDKDGWTPLSWAAACGRNEAVNLLLAKKDVDPDSKDNSDRTPLSLAAEKGHDKVVKVLCQRGSPNIRDKHGRTPLWWAAENKHRRAVKLLIRKDSVTLHMLVQGGKETLVQLLLNAGYDVDACDSSGMTPLRLAILRKDPVLIELLLKHSARTEGIRVSEWLGAYASQATHIVQLSEGNNGEKRVHLSSNELLQKAANTKRQLFVFADHSHWQKVPLTHSKEQLRPNKLQISHQEETSGHGINFSVSLWFPAEQDASKRHFNLPDWGECRIAWTIMPPANPNGEPWKSIDHFSMMPYGWIPNDGVGFFMQFVLYLKERWLKLCDLAEKHLTESRLEQLRSEGKSPELMRRLAKDAQKWAELRPILQDQIRTARKFVTDYCQRYNANQTPKDIQRLDGFEVDVTNRISQLDQTVRELLQIEFAWAAITESRISTRLGQNVMLLTYVSIFYLPLAFCAALWAIPDISDRDTRNPFIITSTIVGLITLVVAFNLENIAGLVGKIYYGWRAKLVRDMRRDNRWKERGEELQESNLTRKVPSEWWLFGYVMYRIIGTIWTSTEKKPGDGDEESKLDEGGTS